MITVITYRRWLSSFLAVSAFQVLEMLQYPLTVTFCLCVCYKTLALIPSRILSCLGTYFLFKETERTVNLAQTSSDHLHLAPACEIPHWLGCPEASATESGRAAEQLSHPYLHSNMAAHRLCMVHAVWGHVLPRITGRQSAQNTSTESRHYTWTVLIINTPGYLW